MTDRPTPIIDPALPRPRGRVDQWSDRVKTLLLLAVLAMAGAMAGLGAGGAEAERVRDGIASGGSGLRTALSDAPVVALQGEQTPARPDASSGGDDHPLPRALAAAPLSPRPPSAAIPVAFAHATHGAFHPRAGHAARMPTGPPAGLSA